MTEPLILGTWVEPWGYVSGIVWTGERYYLLVDKQGSVSFMPATTVEAHLVGKLSG